MTHAPHVTPRRVLADDCHECRSRAKDLNGLSQLDNGNLRSLAALAAELKDAHPFDRPVDASDADVRAVETLRLAARIVYRSGIDPDVAA